MKQQVGLYIHIPFCKKKCLYCDFPSYAGREGEYAAYVTALEAEIEERGKQMQDCEIQTVFFGGGTPTALPKVYLERLTEKVFSSFSVRKDAEITTEANPGTLDKNMAEGLFSMGFNRISMGVQAWQNSLLKTLGRIHSIEEFQENFGAVRQAGFRNINVDLMFALPNQSMEDWRETLEKIIALSPEHISAYSLIVEEDTPFYTLFETGKLTLADEDLDREMYRFAIDFLGEHGYHQYEISNFAKAGFESRHNKIYWETTPYVGLGLGAHSYFRDCRFHNPYDMEEYIKANGLPSLLEQEKIIISEKDALEEFMFMGLRMTRGVSFGEFRKRFGVEMDEFYHCVIEKFCQEGLLMHNKEGISLTERGIDLSNLVFEGFLLDK